MRGDSKDREGVSVDASDRELQQYLFDLQGYLVIHDVLGSAEVAELNRLIDAQQLPSPRERIRFGSAAGVHGPDHGFLNWGVPFCRLLDHEASADDTGRCARRGRSKGHHVLHKYSASDARSGRQWPDLGSRQPREVAERNAAAKAVEHGVQELGPRHHVPRASALTRGPVEPRCRHAGRCRSCRGRCRAACRDAAHGRHSAPARRSLGYARDRRSQGSGAGNCT